MLPVCASMHKGYGLKRVGVWSCWRERHLLPIVSLRHRQTLQEYRSPKKLAQRQVRPDPPQMAAPSHRQSDQHPGQVRFDVFPCFLPVSPLSPSIWSYSLICQARCHSSRHQILGMLAQSCSSSLTFEECQPYSLYHECKTLPPRSSDDRKTREAKGFL